MVSIREVVHQALTTRHLTVAAENQLRQLLTTKYDQEDFNAFITLQQAVIDGWVRQESRELEHSHHSLTS